MGHISGNKPPFLIMHGSADTLVSPRQSAQLYTALKAEKSKADYVLVEGAAHGDIFWFQKSVIETVVGWFKANLGAPIKGNTRVADPKANLEKVFGRPG